MLSVENDATPFTAATVVVPERTPPAGLVPSAIVTLPVKPGTGLPLASSAVTRTAGVIACPATAVFGSVVNTNWVAVPDETLNVVLVAPVSPGAAAVSVYPLPALSRLNVAKVATPFAAATVFVPDKVPPAGSNPSATVTLPV